MYHYLSGSEFLAKLTPRNNQFVKVKSESRSRAYESNS